MDEKIYMSYTGYPGGQRTLTAKVLQSKKPCNSSRKKRKGMLKIRCWTFRNLNVVVGSEHKQGAKTKNS
jgi:large subunit ribosomal protein L13